MTDEKKISFEVALKRLEEIVAAMESGDLSLEESMSRFEEGMRLSSLCSKELGETEKRIELLVKKAGAEAEWQAVAGSGDVGGVAPPSLSNVNLE